MELALFVMAGFFIGWTLGRRIYQWLLLRRAKQIVAALGQMADIFVMAKVEKVDDVYFVYDQTTQEFLAQGRNWEEIRDHFKSRFPKKVCAIDQDVANTIPRLVPASE